MIFGDGYSYTLEREPTLVYQTSLSHRLAAIALFIPRYSYRSKVICFHLLYNSWGTFNFYLIINVLCSVF